MEDEYDAGGLSRVLLVAIMSCRCSMVISPRRIEVVTGDRWKAIYDSRIFSMFKLHMSKWLNLDPGF